MKTISLFTLLIFLFLAVGCANRVRSGASEVLRLKIGKNDDFSLAVREALKKCQRKGIGILELPEGVFKVNTTINLVSNITIRGNQTELKAKFISTSKKGGYPVTIFDTPATGVKSVTLENIKFTGVAKGQRKNLSLSEKQKLGIDC